MSFLGALSEHGFLQLALLGGVLASIGCGLIGPYVVVRRIGYLAGGIAHASMGGMGVAYYYGHEPLIGALVSAVLAAMAVGWVSLRWSEQEDMLIGALWAVGMAVGILFMSQASGYNVDLMSYLFGNILMVTGADLYLMLGLDALMLGLIALFYKQFQAVCFDEEFARLRGVPVTAFYLLLLGMVALAIVLLIQVVGLILVIALITLPAAMAGHWMRSLLGMMLLSALVAVVATSGGLAAAFAPDLPAGATIVLITAALYLLSLAARQFTTGRRAAR
ncbi:metal ABC transporter permease [Ectothiorhodospiraceae bacterium WFHF3C12]|nr:metal ABC transporter permease [Ectothiorhodospiraceae bacterium WFHF3C12]